MFLNISFSFFFRVTIAAINTGEVCIDFQFHFHFFFGIFSRQSKSNCLCKLKKCQNNFFGVSFYSAKTTTKKKNRNSKQFKADTRWRQKDILKCQEVPENGMGFCKAAFCFCRNNDMILCLFPTSPFLFLKIKWFTIESCESIWKKYKNSKLQ